MVNCDRNEIDLVDPTFIRAALGCFILKSRLYICAIGQFFTYVPTIPQFQVLIWLSEAAP